MYLIAGLQVGRMFPQAVYFPIRTLYLTLKIEQRERYKAGELADRRSSSPGQQVSRALKNYHATMKINKYGGKLPNDSSC